MKLALLTVTYSGLFYSGKALSLEEQIRKARELGFEGLTIETKRPVASPSISARRSERASRRSRPTRASSSAHSKASRTSPADSWKTARTTSR